LKKRLNLFRKKYRNKIITKKQNLEHYGKKCEVRGSF